MQFTMEDHHDYALSRLRPQLQRGPTSLLLMRLIGCRFHEKRGGGVMVVKGVGLHIACSAGRVYYIAWQADWQVGVASAVAQQFAANEFLDEIK